jgi:hypothetical protein
MNQYTPSSFDLITKSAHTLSKFKARFWSRVTRDTADRCWQWQGSVASGGYGQIALCEHNLLAHRVAYELHYGAFPRSAWILHRCDNRLCVNPAHLFLGDAQANVDDMVKKGRNAPPKGESHYQSKLNKEQVLSIRARVINGESQRELSREFGVDFSTISKVVRRETWKHI